MTSHSPSATDFLGANTFLNFFPFCGPLPLVSSETGSGTGSAFLWTLGYSFSAGGFLPFGTNLA